MYQNENKIQPKDSYKSLDEKEVDFTSEDKKSNGKEHNIERLRSKQSCNYEPCKTVVQVIIIIKQINKKHQINNDWSPRAGQVPEVINLLDWGTLKHVKGTKFHGQGMQQTVHKYQHTKELLLPNRTKPNGCNWSKLHFILSSFSTHLYAELSE